MRVSVIIPVTRPKELLECFRGLLAQGLDRGEYEVILIRSPELLLSLPETDIRITQILEKNPHTGVRRNLGCRIAQGEYLAFIDDDTVVSSDWLTLAERGIARYGLDGVCGPIHHYQGLEESLSLRLSGAASDSFFLEGFSDSLIQNPGIAAFYNIPLCNCMIRRSVWESVGGFNEKVFYYMDDIEFFYLASRSGFKFFHLPELRVRHGVARFPGPFLKKKFVTRFYVGINTLVFPEIFFRMPYVWLACLSYPALTMFAFLSEQWLANMFLLYVLMALIFSFPYFKKDKKTAWLLPCVFLLTHLTDYFAFAMGWITYLLQFPRYALVRAAKKKRFR